MKVTKSQKAILVIDDLGNSYITSKTSIRNLADDKLSKFLVLTRLPDKVDVSRFPVSPVYNTETKDKEDDPKSDALSRTYQKKKLENYSKYDEVF